ncbi:MAG: GIY-YIG nuclease family protein [bacterium]|nr:GIY-YIG nuclease family protein [bacterium]
MLLIRLRDSYRLTLARHTWCLPPGWYLYVGSAQRSLTVRLRRHFRTQKRRHWHIDYLLRRGTLVTARIYPGMSRPAEAQLAQAWCRVLGANPIPSFGASDSSAPTHLIHFARRRSVEESLLWQCALPWPLQGAPI